MKAIRTEDQVIADLNRVSLELTQTGNYLEGSLQKSVKRYRKKDGKVSEYSLPPVLQYPLPSGGQSRMRIPLRHVQLVRDLLDTGRQRRKLLARHRELSLEWVKLLIRNCEVEKKTT